VDAIDIYSERVYCVNAFTVTQMYNSKVTMEDQIIGHRKKQKAETYNLIFVSAKNLFEEIGFEKTTMKKIAARVGISPGAIFKHFENKSALLAATLFNDLEIVQKKAFDQIPKEETVQKQFLSIAEQFFEYYAVRPDLSKILVEHSLFVEGEWVKKFDTQTMQFINKTVHLIQKAKKQGMVKKNVDNKSLATALFSHYLFVLILCVKDTKIDPYFALGLLSSLVDLTISGSIQKNKETTA
jgi:AcrR family transcriptional regulator